MDCVSGPEMVEKKPAGAGFCPARSALAETGLSRSCFVRDAPKQPEIRFVIRLFCAFPARLSSPPFFSLLFPDACHE